MNQWLKRNVPVLLTFLLCGLLTILAYEVANKLAHRDAVKNVRAEKSSVLSQSSEFRGDVILIAGGLVSLALSAFVWSLSSTRARAVAMARSMNTELVLAKERAERALREISELRLALDHHAILSVADRDGKIIDVNSAFCQISGYSRQELIGRDHNILNSAHHPKSFWNDMWAEIGLGRPWRGEICNRRKDGSLYWVDSTIVPFRDVTDHVVKYVAIRFDITARKQAELERDRLHIELEEASRRAGMAEIATGVLHNVGNVLNNVNTSANVIAEKLKSSKVNGLCMAVGLIQQHDSDLGEFMVSDPKGKQIPAYLRELSTLLSTENSQLLGEVESLFKSVDHMAKVIESQQSFARRGLNPESVDLKELIEESVRINLLTLDKNRIEILRDFQPCPPAFAEKHLILQILVNLVSNAKKAVLHESANQRKIKFSLEPIMLDGVLNIRLRVTDTGVGIAAKDLPKIFQHGFTKSQGGHGFGLHMAAIDARRMGGKLGVHSEGPGMGAEFTLIIPAAQKEAVV